MNPKTNPKLNPLENKLCEAYAGQLDRYARALECLDVALRKLEQRHDADGELCRLRSLIDEVSDIEARIKPVQQEWQSLAVRPGSQMQALLDRLQQTLGTLIEQTRKTEQVAQQSRDRLLPALDRETRTQRMRDAYQTVIDRC